MEMLCFHCVSCVQNKPARVVAWTTGLRTTRIEKNGTKRIINRSCKEPGRDGCWHCVGSGYSKMVGTETNGEWRITWVARPGLGRPCRISGRRTRRAVGRAAFGPGRASGEHFGRAWGPVLGSRTVSWPRWPRRWWRSDHEGSTAAAGGGHGATLTIRLGAGPAGSTIGRPTWLTWTAAGSPAAPGRVPWRSFATWTSDVAATFVAGAKLGLGKPAG